MVSKQLLKVSCGIYYLLTTSDNILDINIGENQISTSKYEKLLGILTDHELTFEDHLLKTVKTVNQ